MVSASEPVVGFRPSEVVGACVSLIRSHPTPGSAIIKTDGRALRGPSHPANSEGSVVRNGICQRCAVHGQPITDASDTQVSADPSVVRRSGLPVTIDGIESVR